MTTNYERAFEARPEVYAAWTQLNGAIKSGMDLRRYELATFAAARRLRSSYCSLAHGEVLRNRFDEPILELALDRRTAGLDETDLAVMDLAERVVDDAASIGDADLQRLRELGLSEAEIMDVVLAAAARCFFSKTLDGVPDSRDRPRLSGRRPHHGRSARCGGDAFMHHELAQAHPRPRTATVLFAVCGFLLVALTLLPPTVHGLGHVLVALWLAALVRAVYVTARRGRGLPIRSGWVLVIALVVAAVGLGIAHLGHARAASADARRERSLSVLENATPVERCIGLSLANWDANPSHRPSGWNKETFATVSHRYCTLAARNRALSDSGEVDSRSAGTITQVVLAQMRARGLLPGARPPGDPGFVEPERV